MFGRYGWRSLNTNDQPPIPLPSGGGGNGNIYTRNKQLVARHDLRRRATDRCSRSGSAGRTRRAARIRRRSARRTRFGITGLPTDARIAGGLPSQAISGYSGVRPPGHQSAVAVPDGLEPEDQLLVADGQAVAQGGLRVPADQRRGAGREPALRPRQLHRPVHASRRRAAANNLYNLADFMLGLRSQYALSTFYIANMRQNLHFTYVQDDIRVNDKLTLNAGLRYEYASPMWEANNALTNFDPVNKVMLTAKDGSIADRALVDPDRNNFGPRLGFAYTRGAQDRRPRRLGHQLRAHQPHRLGEPARHQRSSGRARRGGAGRCDAGVVPADRAGLSGGPDRLVEVQSADRAHQLHPEGLPLEPGAELVPVGPARVRSEHAGGRRLRRQQGGRPAAGRELQPGGAQQLRRPTSRSRRGGRFRPSATSPTSSTAASRGTRRSRRSTNGGWGRRSRSSAR